MELLDGIENVIFFFIIDFFLYILFLIGLGEKY